MRLPKHRLLTGLGPPVHLLGELQRVRPPRRIIEHGLDLVERPLWQPPLRLDEGVDGLNVGGTGLEGPPRVVVGVIDDGHPRNQHRLHIIGRHEVGIPLPIRLKNPVPIRHRQVLIEKIILPHRVGGAGLNPLHQPLPQHGAFLPRQVHGPIKPGGGHLIEAGMVQDRLNPRRPSQDIRHRLEGGLPIQRRRVNIPIHLVVNPRPIGGIPDLIPHHHPIGLRKPHLINRPLRLQQILMHIDRIILNILIKLPDHNLPAVKAFLLPSVKLLLLPRLVEPHQHVVEGLIEVGVDQGAIPLLHLRVRRRQFLNPLIRLLNLALPEHSIDLFKLPLEVHLIRGGGVVEGTLDGRVRQINKIIIIARPHHPEQPSMLPIRQPIRLRKIPHPVINERERIRLAGARLLRRQHNPIHLLRQALHARGRRPHFRGVGVLVLPKPHCLSLQHSHFLLLCWASRFCLIMKRGKSLPNRLCRSKPTLPYRTRHLIFGFLNRQLEPGRFRAGLRPHLRRYPHQSASRQTPGSSRP